MSRVEDNAKIASAKLPLGTTRFGSMRPSRQEFFRLYFARRGARNRRQGSTIEPGWSVLMRMILATDGSPDCNCT